MMQPGATFDLGFRVTDDVYSGFLNTFKDQNPLHTDDGFATAAGFRERVMHGNILNGFVSYFIRECLPIKNVIIQAQSIKFAVPVYLNEELKFHAEIVDFFESVQTYEIKFFFQNQEGMKVAKGNIQIGLLK